MHEPHQMHPVGYLYIVLGALILGGVGYGFYLYPWLVRPAVILAIVAFLGGVAYAVDRMLIERSHRRAIAHTADGMAITRDPRYRVHFQRSGGHVEKVAEPIPEVITALPRRVQLRDYEGQIRRDHILLGMGINGELWGDLNDMLSMIYIGQQGSGKSTGLRTAVRQIQLIGGSANAIDPHGSIAADMGQFINCAEEPDEIRDLSAQVMAVHAERYEIFRRTRCKPESFEPYLLEIDEHAEIAKMVAVMQLVETLPKSGRKVGMYLLLASQVVDAKNFGGSGNRAAFSARLAMRNTDPDQARYAGMPKSGYQLLPSLQGTEPGYGVLSAGRFAPQVISVADTEPWELGSNPRSAPRERLQERSSLLVRSSPAPEIKLPAPAAPDALQVLAAKASPQEQEQIVDLYKELGAMRRIPAAMKRGSDYLKVVRAVLIQRGFVSD